MRRSLGAIAALMLLSGCSANVPDGWVPQVQSQRVLRDVLPRAAVYTDSSSGVYVPGMLRSVAGDVMVVDYGDFSIKWLSGTGELRRTFGSEGEGPGQFRAIQDVTILGDTSMVVTDSHLKRMTYFSLTSDSISVRSWGKERPGVMTIGDEGTQYVLVTYAEYLFKIERSPTDTTGVRVFRPSPNLISEAMLYQGRLSSHRNDALFTFSVQRKFLRLDATGDILFRRTSIEADPSDAPSIQTSGGGVRFAPRPVHTSSNVLGDTLFIGSVGTDGDYFIDAYMATNGDYVYSIPVPASDVRCSFVDTEFIYVCAESHVILFKR